MAENGGGMAQYLGNLFPALIFRRAISFIESLQSTKEAKQNHKFLYHFSRKWLLQEVLIFQKMIVWQKTRTKKLYFNYYFIFVKYILSKVGSFKPPCRFHTHLYIYIVFFIIF